MIYTENWSAGNSLFSSVYRYDRADEGDDPLYPFMESAEGVYINPAGNLDKNPAHTGPFQDYQSAGVHVNNMGTLDINGAVGPGGYWDADRAGIEVTYIPTAAALAENGGTNYCPLLSLFGTALGVAIDLSTGDVDITYEVEGSVVNLTLTPPAAPAAGVPFTVRMEWQCGTMDLGTEITAADGWVRVYINDVLLHEALNVAMFVAYPNSPMSVPNLANGGTFGYFGLLGELDTFTITNEDAAAADPEIDALQVGQVALVWVEAYLSD